MIDNSLVIRALEILSNPLDRSFMTEHRLVVKTRPDIAMSHIFWIFGISLRPTTSEICVNVELYSFHLVRIINYSSVKRALEILSNPLDCSFMTEHRLVVKARTLMYGHCNIWAR